ncbi:MAG: PcfJ domain-containing protein [Paramuribaculum sp.]|nr:PcfJ domain-containing protein [Paramuribaculum sp.]
MKARTKFEKQVVVSNLRLTAVPTKAFEWGVKNLFSHPAFRVPSGATTCGDCGHKFQHKGKGKYVVCPHCGHRLEIKDTLKRTDIQSSYFAVLDTVDGLQVERVFLLTADFKKGEPMSWYKVEVCRLWLNAKGQTALTSMARTIGYYRDCFNWGSKIELRNMSDVHYIIANTWCYPIYKAIPELRRNGMKGRLPDCHPFELMKTLLTDARIETLMKSGNHKAVKYFVGNKSMLDKCWNSHKIAMRHGYKIEDYFLWCDLIKLLEKNGRDTHSTKYICPKNLRAEHDYWLNKPTTPEEKRRKAEQMKLAKRKVADFYKNKSCYFGIIISDKDIEISVLDTIEAYKAEGEIMQHCVFRCEYYGRPDSIILSAHDKQGNRIETVEFSLTEYKVIQSRGYYNELTKYHDRIINLVNANAHRFIQARATV